ncbi:MAG: hypothetical protein IJT52_01875 [Spirochaetales bacterium]|nr:hypothetical protein [Spirochaetales bacterium]
MKYDGTRVRMHKSHFIRPGRGKLPFASIRAPPRPKRSATRAHAAARHSESAIWRRTVLSETAFSASGAPVMSAKPMEANARTRKRRTPGRGYVLMKESFRFTTP